MAQIKTAEFKTSILTKGEALDKLTQTELIALSRSMIIEASIISLSLCVKERASGFDQVTYLLTVLYR